MNFGRFVMLVVALTGCTNHPAAHKFVEPRYRLLIADRPEMERFELTLVSEENAPLCLSVEQWPNNRGEVEGGEQSMLLEVGPEKSIPGKSAPFSTSCPGGCGYLEVESGKPLIGFVGYNQFGDPAQVTHYARRALRFAVNPIRCRATSRRVKQL